MRTPHSVTTIRLPPEEQKAIRREAQALGMTTSAYLRMVVDRGRERLDVLHALSALSPELREAIWRLYAMEAETRALVRALALKHLGEQIARQEQQGIIQPVQDWKTRLRIQDQDAKGGGARP